MPKPRHYNRIKSTILNPEHLSIVKSGTSQVSDGIEHIHEHLALHDSNVLVHCEFGAARSPALMLAVLLTDGVPLSEAQNQILTSRDQATSAYFADAAEWYDWYTS